MAQQGLLRLAKGAFGLGISAFAIDQSIFDVDAGHRAVVFDRYRGVLPDVCGEGTHFMVPILQRPIIYDVRIKPRTISTNTGTKDMQNINISLRVLSQPDEEKLDVIYQTLGQDFDFRVLPSIGNEVMKMIVAKYNADQLLTMREKVSLDIRDELEARAKKFNIVLKDVSITHLTFSKEFTQAIEQKQVAQQEAERSKFVVQKAEQERKAAVIDAEGQSKAAELLSAAIAENGTGMIEVRRIEASREIAHNLARSRNITYLPSSNNMLLNVPA